jgi:hypothetical protein
MVESKSGYSTNEFNGHFEEMAGLGNIDRISAIQPKIKLKTFAGVSC